MIIGLIILLIILILVFSFWYFMKKKETSKKVNRTTVAELIKRFEQMTVLDKGDTYYEMVELVGYIRNKDLIETPFSKKMVAYYTSSANVIARKTEIVKDNIGFDQKRIVDIERTIYDHRAGDKLVFVDDSTSDYVVIEAANSCQIDIPISLDKEVSKEEFKEYNLNLLIPFDDSEIISYKVQESVLENNTPVYVVGEARKSGGIIHICLSKNLKNSFKVTTKLE